jgi:XTP/dITP diphosphohydrolase
MVLILEEYRFFHVQETVWGEIIEEPRGEGGFGYDPVFLFPDIGKTMSEVSMEEKNRRSHRGKAGAAVLKLIGGME